MPEDQAAKPKDAKTEKSEKESKFLDNYFRDLMKLEFPDFHIGSIVDRTRVGDDLMFFFEDGRGRLYSAYIEKGNEHPVLQRVGDAKKSREQERGEGDE